jgi:subfamily B ATP-binding cassette protein MsbA
LKTFFRILSYSPNLTWRLVGFFAFSIISVIFSAVTLVSVMPLLDVLFNQVQGVSTPAEPVFNLSIDYFIDLFQYNFLKIINTYGKTDALLFVCSFILGSMLVGNTFRYLERIVASRVRLDVVKNLRTAIFTNITRLQISFFNTNRKGDLLSRFTSDVQEVEAAAMNSLKAVMKEPITIVVYFAILFTISAELTLITLLVVPLIGALLGDIVRRLKKEAQASQQSLGRVVSTLEETFSGMRVVKAFNARKYILEKMEDENRYNTKVNMSMSYKNELASPFSELLGVVIVASIMYYGGTRILGGDASLTAPQFIGFLTVFASLLAPAKAFAQGLTSLQKGTASARRIFEITDLEPAIENKPNAVELRDFKDNSEFRNVSFAYDKELVLKDINLIITKGKTVALVGPSGGGKSTLADLVPRFYDPTSGDVRIDGMSIRDYDIESLRKQMGIVTQESILFNDTIFNNIAFGMPNISRESVMDAARIANAHDFIMQTEKGYDTFIGERGSRLSGGQRQRLSIARAVLKNPAILILDEATSALDSESEKLVQEALFNLMKNRTSIVIAHRLSTIQHADEILVIQEGQIVERGTHAALSAKGGIYQKLSDIQKR